MATAILSIPTSSGIYRISCVSNGRFYIGSAGNLRRRLRQHLQALKIRKHKNPKMQSSWDKYGKESFSFKVLLLCSASQLIDFEQQFIDGLEAVKQGFNIAKSAMSPMLGRTHSLQSKASIRAARTGTVLSQQTRDKLRKIANANSYKTTQNLIAIWAKRTPEQVNELTKKIAASNTGKKRSLEAIEKFKEVALALWRDPKHKEKMMAAHKDRAAPVWTPEAKAEHSRRLKEYRASSEGINHPTNLGRKVTEETRAKMVASALAREAKKRTAHI